MVHFCCVLKYVKQISHVRVYDFAALQQIYIKRNFVTTTTTTTIIKATNIDGRGIVNAIVDDSTVLRHRSLLKSFIGVKPSTRSLFYSVYQKQKQKQCNQMMMSTRIPFSDDFFFRQLFDSISSTYSYLLADLNTKEAVLIDPVLELAKRDAQLINELDFKLKYALNTHMHADHITGTGYLKQLLPNVQSVISGQSGAKADIHLNDGDVIQFGRHELKAVSTPGHTNGCMNYINVEQGIVFTGDTILIRGCGRTDFQEGDSRTLYKSVHEKIFILPDNFRIYPAHDYKGQLESTIGEEKKFNPRLSKDLDTFIEIMDNLNLPRPKLIDQALPANRECGLYDIPE